MKIDFINIVQKCICVDFLLNTLITSNSYDYSNFLSTIKHENLRNIKLMVYLYESSHLDTIDLEKIHPLKLNRSYDDYISIMLEYHFEIIDSLEKLRNISFNTLYQQLLNSLITSYFNFISLINCFYSKSTTHINSDDPFRDQLSINLDFNTNIDILNINTIPNNQSEKISYEDIRIIALNAIDIFFDCKLDDNLITDEHYEIFFGNNPDNKFYQLFFKSNNKSFKIRIWEKNLRIFYLYQTIINSPQVVPNITKDEAKTLSDSYLSTKLGKTYERLVFDENYLNIYSYMNIPESYKFKYTIVDDYKKNNLSKSLYITIDSRYIGISEIYLL